MVEKTIEIEVWGGCVTDVKGLPEGWTYRIVDRDVTEGIYKPDRRKEND